MNKKTIDIIAIVCLIGAIITGFMLHSDVHHRHIYDNSMLWGTHETIGLIMAAAVIGHCMQHNYWFKNFSKISAVKKHATLVLLTVFILVVISGIILLCGSQSNFISIFHYVGGILVTILAIGHIAKRWRIFKSLFK